MTLSEASRVHPLNEIDIRWYLEQRFKSEATSIYSIAYLSACLKSLKKKINDGVVAVTTICHTPHEEFTGGWEGSEKLAGRVLSHFGIDFHLPPDSGLIC